MAKSYQTFRKRQRERQLREKAQLKRERRQQRREEKKDLPAPESPTLEANLPVLEPAAGPSPGGELPSTDK